MLYKQQVRWRLRQPALAAKQKDATKGRSNLPVTGYNAGPLLEPQATSHQLAATILAFRGVQRLLTLRITRRPKLGANDDNGGY